MLCSYYSNIIIPHIFLNCKGKRRFCELIFYISFKSMMIFYE